MGAGGALWDAALEDDPEPDAADREAMDDPDEDAEAAPVLLKAAAPTKDDA